MTGQVSAGWYPDPFGRTEFRYWDGRQWTQHVAAGGRQAIDPPVARWPAPTANRANTEVQRQAGGNDVFGAQVRGEALFSGQVLVVKQKAKVFEVNAEYAVYDATARGQAEREVAV